MGPDLCPDHNDNWALVPLDAPRLIKLYRRFEEGMTAFGDLTVTFAWKEKAAFSPAPFRCAATAQSRKLNTFRISAVLTQSNYKVGIIRKHFPSESNTAYYSTCNAFLTSILPVRQG